MRKKLFYILIVSEFSFLPLNALGEKDGLAVATDSFGEFRAEHLFESVDELEEGSAEGQNTAVSEDVLAEEPRVKVDAIGSDEGTVSSAEIDAQILEGVVASLNESLPGTGGENPFYWAWSFVCESLVNPVAQAYSTLTSEVKRYVLGHIHGVVKSLEAALKAQLESSGVQDQVLLQALKNASIMQQAIHGVPAAADVPNAPPIPAVVKRSYLSEASSTSSESAAVPKKMVKPQAHGYLDSLLAEMRERKKLNSVSLRQLPAPVPTSASTSESETCRDLRSILSDSLDRRRESLYPDADADSRFPVDSTEE